MSMAATDWISRFTRYILTTYRTSLSGDDFDDIAGDLWPDPSWQVLAPEQAAKTWWTDAMEDPYDVARLGEAPGR